MRGVRPALLRQIMADQRRQQLVPERIGDSLIARHLSLEEGVDLGQVVQDSSALHDCGPLCPVVLAHSLGSGSSGTAPPVEKPKLSNLNGASAFPALRATVTRNRWLVDPEL